MFLLLHSPSPQKEGYILNRYKPIKRDNKLHLKLPPFHKAGYYDWRFVTVNSDGLFVPIPKMDLSRIQGRVIVHPKMREELVHEIWVELEGCEWDKNTGNIIKKGTFASVTKNIPEYKRRYGITTIYIMGALDRPPCRL